MGLRNILLAALNVIGICAIKESSNFYLKKKTKEKKKTKVIFKNQENYII